MAQWLSYPTFSGPFSGQEQLLAASSTSPGAGMIRIPWSAVNGLIAGTGFLPLTGGSLSGPLTLPGNATLPLQAVPLQQVQAITGGPFLQLAGGTLTGPLTLAADPTVALGAATKEYVDGAVAGGSFLPLTGGTVTGPIVLPGNATLPLQAVPLQQVTSIIGGPYLPLGGGTLTGALVLAADPTLSLGAATKQYVDAAVVSGPFLPLAGGTVTGATTFSVDVTFSGAGTGLAVSNNATVGGTFAATGGINGTPVGAVTPSTGAFTNLTASGTVTLPSTTTGPFLLLTGGTVSGPTTFSSSGTALTVTNGLSAGSGAFASALAPISGSAFGSLIAANTTTSGTITSPTGFQSWYQFNITTDNATLPSNSGASGFTVIHSYGGAAFQGNRNGLNVQLKQTGTATPGAMIGAQIMATANGNVGGTGTTLATAKGSIYGISSYSVLATGATDYYIVNCEEKDMVVQTGASVAIKAGLVIAQLSNDAVRGSVVDGAFIIGNQAGASGWLTGMAFGRPDGVWPLATTATIFGTYRGGVHQMAVANGINFNDIYFTGNAFSSPGFTVTGAAVTSIGGVVVTPSPTSVSVDTIGSSVTAAVVASSGAGWVVGYALYDAYGNQWTAATVGGGGALLTVTLVSAGYVTGTPPSNPITVHDTTGILAATLTLTWAKAATLALQPSGGAITFGGTHQAGQPYFHATLSSDQSVTSTMATKCQFNSVQFDSNSAYDNVTNYRFTPQKAGTYRVRVSIAVGGVGTIGGVWQTAIYKNGSQVSVAQWITPSVAAFVITINCERMVTMNGTTDYVEGWGVSAGTSGTKFTGSDSFFEASYVSV